MAERASISSLRRLLTEVKALRTLGMLLIKGVMCRRPLPIVIAQMTRVSRSMMISHLPPRLSRLLRLSCAHRRLPRRRHPLRRFSSQLSSLPRRLARAHRRHPRPSRHALRRLARPRLEADSSARLSSSRRPARAIRPLHGRQCGRLRLVDRRSRACHARLNQPTAYLSAT